MRSQTDHGVIHIPVTSSNKPSTMPASAGTVQMPFTSSDEPSTMPASSGIIQIPFTSSNKPSTSTCAILELSSMELLPEHVPSQTAANMQHSSAAPMISSVRSVTVNEHQDEDMKGGAVVSVDINAQHTWAQRFSKQSDHDTCGMCS